MVISCILFVYTLQLMPIDKTCIDVLRASGIFIKLMLQNMGGHEKQLSMFYCAFNLFLKSRADSK